MTLRQALGFSRGLSFWRLGIRAGKDHIQSMEGCIMPLTHFLGLLTLVILAAAMTVLLLVWAEAPLAAVGLAALAGSLVLGARQWR